MLYLLNWRIWLLVGLLALGPLGYFKGRTDGKKLVKADWAASVIAANAEARSLEQRRQDRANEAAVLGTKRQAVIADRAARADDAVRGLRDAIAAKHNAEESAASAAKRADALGKLLAEGAEAYRGLAQRCDKHVSDLRMLLDAWPK